MNIEIRKTPRAYDLPARAIAANWVAGAAVMKDHE
jgi:hypothetical protein